MLLCYQVAAFLSSLFPLGVFRAFALLGGGDFLRRKHKTHHTTTNQTAQNTPHTQTTRARERAQHRFLLFLWPLIARHACLVFALALHYHHTLHTCAAFALLSARTRTLARARSQSLQQTALFCLESLRIKTHCLFVFGFFCLFVCAAFARHTLVVPPSLYSRHACTRARRLCFVCL